MKPNRLAQFTLAAAMAATAATFTAAAASPEAAAALNYLQSISGKHLIAGQHNYLETPGRFQNEVQRITGKYPGVWGCDFGYGHPPEQMAKMRQKLVDEAKAEYKAGSIITLCYHQVKPGDLESAGWKSVQGRLTDQQMQDVVTPGTALYNQWLAQVDDVAAYLKQLKQAGVPVLWRPYHEGNAPWFWWGNRAAAYKQLWINLHNRLVDYHGLDNLIWVYCADQKGAGMNEFYPGDACVDVVGKDLYHGFDTTAYNDLIALAHGRPIAITECGPLPDMDTIQKTLPNYCYFLVWPNFIKDQPAATFQAVYSHPYTLTREQLPKSSEK